MSEEQPQEDDTPEQALRKRLIRMVEEANGVDDVTLVFVTPYLLVKVLERLESIEGSLSAVDQNVRDFWNSRYNT